MSLEETRLTFEKLGRSDPLWAVLTASRYKNNRWDPEEVFETGRNEIRQVLAYVDTLPITLRREKALDFGCGVGRLSQPLADYFSQVTAVDIAESFIEVARNYNRHGNRCQYIQNTTDDLKQFERDQFDFIYSNISLQHSPPDHILKYISEFVRILRDGGVAIFQVPAGMTPFDGTISWVLRRFRWRFIAPMKRRRKTMRGETIIPFYSVPRALIEHVIDTSEGRIVDIVENHAAGKGWVSLQYCVVR
jgi:2-polyprenyl-3-methyl-5-hydroxy-6-metoxy-1,4-benzoquinol methylase